MINLANRRYDMEIIDSIKVNFNPEQLTILNLCLAFIMFGVALDLKLENFKLLFKEPKAAIVGIISQMILLPLITIGLIFLFQPPTSVALGMLLVSVCPGGNVSNFAVHMARGNVALSVFLTTTSTLAAAFTTPLLFTLLTPLIPGGKAFQQAVAVPLIDMVSTIVQLIVIPLIIGMFVNYRFPKFTDTIRKSIRTLSLLIFAGFVIVAIMGNLDNLKNYLHLVFFIVLMHNAIALFSGYGFALLNGLRAYDARAISLETGIQNSGLALIIIFNFYDGLGGMAMIAAWWGVWHLISASTMAFIWNRRRLQD
ncbi:MAG: bile acid:sodium symporter family protein [Saprospiraceae bacterium]|nr:bile acid:sodium symporter family protein [Saprospiraceae bacterium]